MSDAPKDGGPAFAHGNPEQGGDPGMSLRDYFAGQALAGILACGPAAPMDAAAFAYRYANTMIKEREKNE